LGYDGVANHGTSNRTGAATVAIEIGAVISGKRDRWEVLDRLGRGATSETLRVRSVSSREPAVLKLSHLAQIRDWKAVELFQREVEILQTLDHPGIPRYLDCVDNADSSQGLIQTFIAGRTLQAVIDGAPLSTARFEAVLRDTLDTLAYLHEHSPPVVHRDLKPANIMLDDARAYIIDFGSVKWTLRESAELTSVGTFGYMAPEQVLGRAEPASDIYALGMSFVALATGRDPADFEVDPNTGQIDVRSMLLRLPERIAEVLVAMTRPGIGQRLADARAALRMLDSPTAAPTLPSTRPPASTISPLAASRSRRLTGLGAGLGAVLGVGALVAVAALTLPGSSEPPIPASEASPPSEPTASRAPPSEATRRPPAAPVLVTRPTTPASPASEAATGSSTVRLRSDPPGASVLLPDGDRCTTPCDVSVPHGRRTFAFSQSGRTLTRQPMVIEDLTLMVSF
jgi:serine/threonine protein kinase